MDNETPQQNKIQTHMVLMNKPHNSPAKENSVPRLTRCHGRLQVSCHERDCLSHDVVFVIVRVCLHLPAETSSLPSPTDTVCVHYRPLRKSFDIDFYFLCYLSIYEFIYLLSMKVRI